MERAYAAAGIEPPLEELLNDRIVQLIMRRDGIAPADVWRAVQAARWRLAASTHDAEEEARGLNAAIELLPNVGADSDTRSG